MTDFIYVDGEPLGDVERDVMLECDEWASTPIAPLDLTGDGSAWEDWN